MTYCTKLGAAVV